ncbi:T9SS type A sorting domain-containing protein [Hymenobacter sp. BT664]|uniref:T9SS type A sorting domain-containing protein n=1 Tax=Hymenobacter montanus TaxID=2771359 RepID=A0A927GJQ1_9BACT|nr:T9SS type A sorting domain-containing protein [Hymenobacter montanus]MBD2768728.1 T9SS type A sorting domain-containing protein [Hymenobacter montanus]
MRITVRFRPWMALFALVATLSLSSFRGQAQDPTWASVRRAASTTNTASYGDAIAVAPDGSRFFHGTFQGSFTFGGTTLTAVGAGFDSYLGKLNPDGSLAWLRQYSGGLPWKLAVDATGNLYVGGNLGGTISFGSLTLTGPGGLRAFVAKLTPQGEGLWGKVEEAPQAARGDCFLSSLITDAAGNVYASGNFSGTMRFGSEAANQLMTTNNAVFDIFLCKFSPSGSVLWARKAGGEGNDDNRDLAADASGNTYLTGNFTGSATFGTVTLNAANATDQDLYVAKFDPQGNVVWAQRAGTANDDTGEAVAVDAAGVVAVGGNVNSRLVGAGFQRAAYLACYGANGSPLWSREITPSIPGLYSVKDVAYDGRGGLYAIGDYEGALTLGGTPLPLAGKPSAFVARYNGQGTARWAGAGIAEGAGPNDGCSFDYIDADATGNAYLLGAAVGNVSFGSLNSVGSTNATLFEAKLNSGSVLAAARTPGAALPLTVYPNPASGQTTLVLPQGGGELTITDGLGRVVRTQALPAVAGAVELGLGGLAPGLYQLRARLSNGQTAATPLLVH